MAKKASILIIEPDKILAETFQQALIHAGLDVEILADAQAGISAVDASKPDLIILELQLAAHNGVEFLHELRSYPEWQTIPVVILSQVPEAEAGMGADLFKKLSIAAYAYKYQTTLTQLVKIVKTAL